MPVIGSGLGSSAGISPVEAAYGTNTTVTRWWELDSSKLQFRPNRFEGKGLAAGQLTQVEAQRVTTTSDAGGQLKGMVFQKKMGLWLANAMGSTATPTQVGGTTAYTQTHVLGSQTGIFNTVQLGVPNTTGTANPYTFFGGKITQVQFECGVDTPLTATFDVDFQGVTEVTTLTAPSFTTANPEFHWAQMGVSLGVIGSEAAVEGVTKWTCTIKRAVADKRFYADGTGLKSEPIQNDFFDIEHTFDIDLVTKADFVDRFVSDVTTSVIVTFTGPVIVSANHYLFQLSTPAVHFNAETPTVDGPQLVSPKITGKALYNESNAAATLVYQSTDTSL